ncbi:MAG: hypothetical protein ACOCZQ_03250 [Nanoarchaeota archaeon]
MGKIKPKKKKPAKKKKIFAPGSALALFVIFIMIGSAIGFVMLGSPTGGEEQGDRVYEDYVFSMTQDGLWVTEYENRHLRFHNLPNAVESIEIPREAIESILNAGTITLTFHPEDENIKFIEGTRMELEDQLQRELGIMVQTGVLENVEPYEEIPVIDCENATPQNVVIKMQTKDEQEISYENNCLQLNSNVGNSFYKMKDRLVYTLTGIIED